MKLIMSLSIAIFALNTYALDTVDSLDLESYMGKWHQLAAMPQRFSKDCVRDTLAEYRRLDNGLVEVKNSCFEADGSLSVANGRARINKKFDDSAKLQVTFVKILKKWSFVFSGDYWVMDVDTDYQWAVVGHPELSGLYILSRTPTLPNSKLKDMRDLIELSGYDSCDTIMSQTTGGPYTGTERLCDLKL